jgi:uncharacterized protein YybS (DUF2232 family)
MNQTKKMTQGAMMLAITGALILIDRMTAYWFTEFVVLIMPIVLIMYATMHTLKDGVLLSVGLLIISFLLGNFQLTYLIYVPVGIVTGLVYAWGIKRGLDKRRLVLSAIVTYVIGELIATFIVYPLMGFPIKQMLAEYEAAFTSTSNFMGMDYASLFKAAGLDLSKLLVVIYIVSTIIMGAMEGVLIHLLSVFLLKRFKIKDLGNTNIFDLKPKPLVAYIALIMASLMFVVRYVDNETFYYIAMVLSVCGVVVLLYYGYLFIVLYGIIVLRRNVGGLFVLLCFLLPGLIYVMVLLGFLYGSGPLRTYLEKQMAKRISERQQQQ